MADLSSTKNLYLSVTQLAYAVSQLAINPRPPFNVSDRPALLAQGTAVADCAARLRQKNGNALDQGKVFAAQIQVDTAMSMFYVINNMVSNSYAQAQVTAAVVMAIAEVDAL